MHCVFVLFLFCLWRSVSVSASLYLVLVIVDRTAGHGCLAARTVYVIYLYSPPISNNGYINKYCIVYFMFDMI